MLDQNLVLKANELFTAGSTETDGSREIAAGLYLRDTRHLAVLSMTMGGRACERLSVQQTDLTEATIILANPAMYLADDQFLAPQSLLVTQSIRMSDQFSVTISITNLARERVTLPIEITVGSDFRDLFDIRGFARHQRGIVLQPELRADRVRLAYRSLDDHIAATTVSFDRPPTFQLGTGAVLAANPGLTHLPPSRRERERQLAESWPVVIAAWEAVIDHAGTWTLTITAVPEPADGSRVEAASPNWPVTLASTHDPSLDQVLVQSIADLAALDTDFADGPLIAAGIPWFVAPFGRDSLIAALQTLHLTPDRAKATLRTMAKLQGTRVDERKEEEPGKIPHEMRYGEMARLGEVPHSPYFGTVDATPLWLWLLAETVTWTHDQTLYDELRPHANAAIRWCEEFGDLDGDGLIEYRSDHAGPGTITHQVWKDSYDSIHHADGSIPASPIAAVEVQGYAYAGYRQLAAVARDFGDLEWADELDTRANALQKRVEEAFWIAEGHYYAQALDRDKIPVAVLSSNPGHLLATGLPSDERANLLIDRMMQPDLFTHWGVRTLSETAPTYNPISYHNGSIWPHDNSLIGFGCYRYGRRDAGDQILGALVAAAETIPNHRLPELYCGFDVTDHAAQAPVPYPVSCSPQAWAAGAVPFLLRGKLQWPSVPVI